MAKLTGPLMSFGASGQIGKALVIGDWRGIKYARQYVRPANPQTVAQQANRTRFAFLREAYKLAPALVRLAWDAFSVGRPFTGANKFVGENNRILNSTGDLNDAIMSPGARGGLPPQSVVGAATANPGELTVTIVPPDDVPTGWMVTRVIAAAMVAQDPTGLFSGAFPAGSDDSDPYVVTLDGFESGQDVVAFGWVEYSKPDGKLAYSVSLSDAVTVA